MKRLWKRRNKSIYTTIRFALAVVVIVAALGTAFVSFFINKQTMIDTARQNDHLLLEMHRSLMDSMKALAFKIGHQVYSDNQMASLLYGEDNQLADQYRSLLQLNNYRSSLPYIESIYVYNGSANALTISSRHSGAMGVRLDQNSGIVDPLIRRIIETATVQDIMSAYPHMIRYPENYKKDTFCYTFVVSEMFGTEKMRQAVFVNFSAGWLQQIVTEQQNSPSETLILDENGMVVFSTREQNIFRDMSQSELFRVVGNCKGNLVAEVDGTQVIITLLPKDENGWHYVRLTPMRVVQESGYRVLVTMLLIDAGLILIYVVLSMLVSKRLYRPIDSMSRKLDDASAKQQKLEHDDQRKRMLRKLLVDAVGSEQHEVLVNEVRLTDVQISEAAEYYVLVVRIDKYNRFCNTYSLHERAERMQNLIQIGMDVFGQSFSIRTMELGEGSNIVFVLMRNECCEMVRQQWTQLIDEMRNRALNRLSIKFSCALSGPSNHLSDLSALYHQAYNALKYRIFMGGNSTIFSVEIQRYADTPYTYPEKLESQMIAAVMSDDRDQAKTVANDILWRTATRPFIEIRLTISRLTMSMLMMIAKLENGGFEFPDTVRETLMTAASLDEIESFGTTVEYFDSVIDQLCAGLHTKRDTRHADLVKQINDMIEQSYMDPDCNLTYLAEKINMSPAYLTRLYCSYMLQSVPDKINEVRMQAARCLLREHKELSITEISAKVGFSSSSYFSKAFRKTHGMTPNEYRNNNQQEE